MRLNFAGKGGSRPAKYDDLLKIADGRVSSDAPQALQDKAREVDRGGTGGMEVALAAARSARFLELKDQEADPEMRAARVTEEVLAIEDGVRIYRPTPAQQMLVELEDRVLAIEDRRDRPRGRQATGRGPTIALGDRAASSRGSARRPETVEEKRKRHAEAARRTAGARSQADWENMRRVAADTAGHARRVREQQFISAVQG